MFKIKDVIATTYVLLNNCSEEELDYVVVVEQLASVLTQMKTEKLLSNSDDVIYKGTVTFNDTTGLVTNSLTNFGTPVYLEYNGIPIDESPVAQLDVFAEMGVQRAAFWTDASTGLNKIQLSVQEAGTLKIWYESSISILLKPDSDVQLQDSLKYCLASRLAQRCIPYVNFKDMKKVASLPVVALSLSNQAEDWRHIYLELVNRIGMNRPFTRVPFVAASPY